MTVPRRLSAEALAELIDPEYLDAVVKEIQRNNEFFLAHERDIWDQHPAKSVLVHSGTQVEAFDEFSDLLRRRESLAPVTRDGSLCRWQREGLWIL